jgi:hypothetical protein
MKSFRDLMNLIQNSNQPNPAGRRRAPKAPPPSTMENLTAMERSLKNILQHCVTQEQMETFIAALPSPQLQKMARNVVEHMVLQLIDKQTKQPQSVSQAAEYLGKFTR